MVIMEDLSRKILYFKLLYIVKKKRKKSETQIRKKENEENKMRKTITEKRNCE